MTNKCRGCSKNSNTFFANILSDKQIKIGVMTFLYNQKTENTFIIILRLCILFIICVPVVFQTLTSVDICRFFLSLHCFTKFRMIVFKRTFVCQSQKTINLNISITRIYATIIQFTGLASYITRFKPPFST